MRTIFTRLFTYNHSMNLTMAKIIIDNAAAPPDCMKFLGHILNAQEIWLGRIDTEKQKNMDVLQAREKSEIEEMLSQDHDNWMNYLKNTEEEDFLKIVNYKNSKGDAFENRVLDMIYHVINHSTHHRAQISLLLRQNGITPPITDYIFYLREHH